MISTLVLVDFCHSFFCSISLFKETENGLNGDNKFFQILIPLFGAYRYDTVKVSHFASLSGY